MAKRRDFHAENRLAADRAFTADQPHLDAIALVGAGKHRNEAVLDEIDMLDGDAGVLEHAARRECHFFKEGREALQVALRQRPQQANCAGEPFRPPARASNVSSPVHIVRLDIW